MPRDLRFLQLVLILGALSAIGPMSIDMYLPAFPVMAKELGATEGQMAYTLSAFFIGLAGGQLVYGPLGDRFGRKGPMVVGLLVYAAASVGCMLADSAADIVVLRGLQALGACGGMVLGRAMVRDLFEAEASAKVFSMLTLVMGVAPILAPIAGGWVLAHAGWPAIFGCLVGFGLLLVVAVAGGLPETLKPEERQKLGFWAIARVYGRLLTQGRFMGLALAGAAGSAGMFAYIAGSPFVFITLNGVSSERYGLYFGLNAAGLIALSQVNTWLLNHASPTAILRGVLVFTALSGVAVVFAAWSGLGGFFGLLIPIFAYVASLGMVMPNAMAAAMATQRSHFGQASAVIGMVQFGLATVAGALVGALHNGTALTMAGVMAGCSSMALLAVLLAMRREAVPSASTEMGPAA